VTHKHWRKPGDGSATNLALPEYPLGYDRAPDCPHPTKHACDRQWTEYQHYHPGRRCRKGQVARDNNRKMVTVCLVEEEARPAHLADLHERALRSRVGSMSLHNSHD